MKFRYIFLILLTCLSFAQATIQQTDFTNGEIQISSPIISQHIQNQNFLFQIHIYNSSTGKIISQGQIDYCSIHIHSPDDGSHLIEKNMTADGNGLDWELDISSGNFSQAGEYGVVFYCESGSRGGFFGYSFYVMPSSVSPTTSEALVYLLFCVVILTVLLIMAFFVISMPSENERDDQGFDTKIIRIKYIRAIVLIMMWPISIILLNLLNGLAINFATLSIFSGTIGFLFDIMLRLSWMVIVIWIAWMVAMLIHDTNVWKKLNKLERLNLQNP